jgi:hypothetical protein
MNEEDQKLANELEEFKEVIWKLAQTNKFARKVYDEIFAIKIDNPIISKR